MSGEGGEETRDDVIRRAMRAGNAARRATAERDECIPLLRDHGISLRKIGEIVGMTHTGVAYVLKEADTAAN